MTGTGDATPTSGTVPLLLLVDDVPDNREMYAEYFAMFGYRIIEAGSGQEAIDRALADAPDLIVMDLSLPGLDGWEATRRLKGDPRTRRIPVIALTGHALAGHSRGAREVGCDAFVAKPCLPERLLTEVRKQLERAALPSLPR